MSNDPPTPEQDDAGAVEVADEPQPSVFGNLPRTRPGARSPRRAERSPEAAEPTPAVDADTEATPPRDATSEPDAREPGSEGAGLDDLAWAGVAAAAEAATIGVRLANRALEAVKDAVERR